MSFLRHLAISLVFAFGTVFAQDTKPTVFLIGDSTVKNSTRGQMGWGAKLGSYFDESRVRVENRALGGRSSRTYLREGLWEEVMKQLKPGDFVIMQFGHNDNGPFDDAKARASIKGNGDETRDVTLKETGTAEVVHSYGWYLRKYIADAKEKGATPIVCSLIPRNIWKGDRVVRATSDFGSWAREAAEQGGACFIDLNTLIADRYDAVGPDAVRQFFTSADHTHTSEAGAALNAGCVVDGIKGLNDCALARYLRTPAAARLR